MLGVDLCHYNSYNPDDRDRSGSNRHGLCVRPINKAVEEPDQGSSFFAPASAARAGKRGPHSRDGAGSHEGIEAELL